MRIGEVLHQCLGYNALGAYETQTKEPHMIRVALKVLVTAVAVFAIFMGKEAEG